MHGYISNQRITRNILGFDADSWNTFRKMLITILVYEFYISGT